MGSVALPLGQDGGSAVAAGALNAREALARRESALDTAQGSRSSVVPAIPTNGSWDTDDAFRGETMIITSDWRAGAGMDDSSPDDWNARRSVVRTTFPGWIEEFDFKEHGRRVLDIVRSDPALGEAASDDSLDCVFFVFLNDDFLKVSKRRSESVTAAADGDTLLGALFQLYDEKVRYVIKLYAQNINAATAPRVLKALHETYDDAVRTRQWPAENWGQCPVEPVVEGRGGPSWGKTAARAAYGGVALGAASVILLANSKGDGTLGSGLNVGRRCVESVASALFMIGEAAVEQGARAGAAALTVAVDGAQSVGCATERFLFPGQGPSVGPAQTAGPPPRLPSKFNPFCQPPLGGSSPSPGAGGIAPGSGGTKPKM